MSTEQATISYHDPCSIAEGVVYAVAEIYEIDPVNLPPLGKYIDRDALNKMFCTTDTIRKRTGQITFLYGELLITVCVQAEGSLSIEATCDAQITSED